MKKSIKRILSTASTGVLIITSLLCLILVTKSMFGAEPSIFGYRCFYIVTGSMEPVVPADSVIIVHKQSTYSVDDIVTFRSNDAAIKGSPNTHRIIETRTDGGTVYFRTKGDANAIPDDDEITIESIYGKMVFQTRRAEWIGTFLTFMVTPAGFLTIIGVPVILLAIVSMKDYMRALRSGIKKQETVLNNASEDRKNSTDTSDDDPEKKNTDKTDEKEERL